LLCPYRGAVFHSISITTTNFGGWVEQRNPTQLFDRQLALSLAEITDTPQAEADAVTFGNFVADTILPSLVTTHTP